MLDCARRLREVVVPFTVLVRPAGDCCGYFWASQHRKHMSKLESWRKLGLKTHDVHRKAARPGLGEPGERASSPQEEEDEETDPWEHSCGGQGHSPSSWMGSGQGPGELAEPPSYKVPNPQLDQALSNLAEL